MVDPTASNPRPVDRLVASINGTPEHPEIRGTVTFTRVGDNVEVQTNLQNLPSGTHAYHVHVFGDCSNPGADSAGPHLDFKALSASTGVTPLGSGTPSSSSASPGYSTPSPGTTGPSGTTPSGTPGGTTGGAASGSNKTAGETPPSGTSSAGMPDSRVAGNLGDLNASKGKATQASTTLILPASSIGMLNGRAVVIHTGANDPKSPDGGAGTPIACGVIGVANEMTSLPTHEGTDQTPPIHSSPGSPDDSNEPNPK